MTYPKTVEEFNKLSYSIQGSLWPRCKSCGHIAQEHNESDCGYFKYGGKCPTCHTYQSHIMIKCHCKGYDGPRTIEELITYLNKD